MFYRSIVVSVFGRWVKSEGFRVEISVASLAGSEILRRSSAKSIPGVEGAVLPFDIGDSRTITIGAVGGAVACNVPMRWTTRGAPLPFPG